MDSQKLDFWKEAILRENMLRLKWFRDHGSNKTKIKLIQKVSEKEKIQLPEIKHHQPKHDAKLLAVPATTEPPPNKKAEETGFVIMRPPSENTRKALYEGISKEETGRYKYLLLRKREKPEEKYSYPFTSNWLYGWGLGHMTKTYVPKHGHNAIVRDTFFRKNGIFPHSSTSDIVA